MAIDDTTLSDICERVANGESLTVIAPDMGFKYTTLLAHIRKNPDADKHYEQALKDRNEWVIERVLSEIRMLSFMDISLLYDEDGHPLPVKDWPKGMGRAVQSCTTNKLFDGHGSDKEEIGSTTTIKLWNKDKQIEMLGKNLDLFTDRVNIEGKMTLEDLLDKTWNGDDK